MIVRLAFPFTTNSLWFGSLWLDWPLFAMEMLVIAVMIGIVESTMARLRLTHIPVLLVAACLLAAFGIILLFKVNP